MENPQYYQIYETLFNKIKSGELQDGSLLEPELDLARLYQVSRVTIRKALELLVNQGLISRQRGKGSFVTYKRGVEPIRESSMTPSNTYNRLIGLIMPEISSSYGMKLLEGIEHQAEQMGFYLVMKLTKGEQKNEEKAVRDLLALGATGLIILPQHGEYYNPAIMELTLKEFPFVLIDLEMKGLKCSYVGSDNRNGARIGMNYLFDRGHRNILYMSPPVAHTSTLEDRLEGVRDALKQKDISLPEEYIQKDFQSTMPEKNSLENIEKDKTLLKAFLESHPETTAVFASEYNLALVASKTLEEIGKRVPEEVSIICFDSPSDHFHRYVYTHLEQDERLIGSSAMKSLHKIIDGSRESIRKILPVQLIEGESIRSVSR